MGSTIPGLECLYGVKYSLQEHPALHKKEYFWRHRDSFEIQRESAVYLENPSPEAFYKLLAIWNYMGMGAYTYCPKKIF